MTEKQLMNLIEGRLQDRLEAYMAAAEAEHTLPLNKQYNIDRIQVTKAILWELEDIKDLYDI